MRNLKLTLLLLIRLSVLSVFCSSCVEEFRFENETFEYVLVIDATITNEEKQHQIFINRAHRFEEDGPNLVTGATVLVTTESETIPFAEESPGIYTSTIAFKAEKNKAYTLEITTQNGKVYTSSPEILTTETTIDNLYPERTTNDDGVNGMAILLDSYDPTNSSVFYRYEFEETFKVVAPMWKDQDAYIVSDNYPDCIVGLTPRSVDEITCYRTDRSNFINQFSTKSLLEDRVSEFLVRFLSSNDYQISHRYSILVTQFVQTEAAYEYFKTLGNFNDEASLFSQVQAGYISGNIKSQSDPNEKIVGFFEVSSIDSKRIYFNYADFYPGVDLPPYAVPCTEAAPDLVGLSHNYTCGSIMPVIRTNAQKFLKINTGQFPRGGPYVMVPRACGDCTALGSTEPPEFWIE